MRPPSRRAFLYAAGLGGAGIVGLRCAFPWFLRARPLRAVEELSEGARARIRRAFADVDPERLWDLHAHVVGLGTGGSGCWVNPRMRSYAHPIDRLRFEIYFSAAGVRDEESADREYVERLFALHRAANPRGRLVLLAFDMNVSPDGEEVPEESPFFTPNDYVLDLAEGRDDVSVCASVHPYRRDALARLERVLDRGAVAIKWLPNSMGIDPASPRCDAFYRVLEERGVPLLTHTGLEKAVRADEAQRLGNPLRLRRPLDAGVRIVAAHCASLGESLDLDHSESERIEADSFDLFMRLMGEDSYRDNLFGEISALTQVNRSRRPLRELLCAEELHPRLVNGSDYPLPAVNPLISTRILAMRGYLDGEDRAILNEVFEANPLLFDYLVKRTVRWERDGRVHRFAPVVFETARLFES